MFLKIPYIARKEWTHEMPGKNVKRGRRVSVTFRLANF